MFSLILGMLKQWEGMFSATRLCSGAAPKACRRFKLIGSSWASAPCRKKTCGHACELGPPTASSVLRMITGSTTP